MFLDPSGALFCVMDSVPGTLLLAFDIATGSNLLSVEVPFGLGSLAFSTSGQLYLGTAAGLFTLLPPPLTASCSPTPSSAPPPPAPTVAPSVVLPALAWSAQGACIGVVVALGIVAALPRLRNWLAPPQLQPPGVGGPAFAAADYVQLN